MLKALFLVFSKRQRKRCGSKLGNLPKTVQKFQDMKGQLCTNVSLHILYVRRTICILTRFSDFPLNYFICPQFSSKCKTSGGEIMFQRHSMATANLNKSEEFVTNTTAASKYIPRRPRISINLNPPFQTSLHKFFKNCFL